MSGNGHFKNWVQLKPCPKCKAKHGWFEKLICKYEQHYCADGTVDSATTIERVRGGERRFCCQCERDISDLVGLPDDSEN